jgi:hemolysin D
MKLVPRMQWLELEQQRIEQVRQRDVERNNRASLDAAIANIGHRRAAREAEFAQDLLAELTEVENRLAAYRQEHVKAAQRITLQTLSAPVSGSVQQLAVHTIGGVVTPAQDLMHIVPDGEVMEIEAWVQNKDIGFVRAGQPARIKVETFPFTRYGTLGGEVRTVSRDATPDERLGPVYAARVRMHEATVKVEDRLVNLAPGMAVTVEVKLGTRRLIEYLLTPLLRYRDESARER